MASTADLLRAVEGAFVVTGRGLRAWPDPHPARRPSDDEYSRVTDPGKWLIVGARAEAWLVALGETDLARVERDASVEWMAEPHTSITRTDRALPRRAGALPLVVARSTIGDVDEAGVTLGVGDPAVCIGWLPQCGCDACDSGSQNELDELDRMLLGIVSGRFRRLTSGTCVITQFERDGWSASNNFGRVDVGAVLADPTGWHEISGASWITTS